jgi:carbon monoxide dehydrogenase subunit G
MLSFHPTAERSAPRLRGLAALRHAVTALAALAVLTVSVGALAAPPRAAAPRVAFDVARDGASITVRATALVRADRETVWRTLVDYPRLPDFIPDMQFSALVSRQGDDALVHQSGRAGIGPFTRGFSLTLAVHEVPLREVSARAVEGDFERFESSYVLGAAGDEPGATRLNYVASITPRGGIPPLVGVPIMRAAMQRQFEALIVEMDRRGRLGTLQAAAD